MIAILVELKRRRRRKDAHQEQQVLASIQEQPASYSFELAEGQLSENSSSSILLTSDRLVMCSSAASRLATTTTTTATQQAPSSDRLRPQNGDDDDIRPQHRRRRQQLPSKAGSSRCIRRRRRLAPAAAAKSAILINRGQSLLSLLLLSFVSIAFISSITLSNLTHFAAATSITTTSTSNSQQQSQQQAQLLQSQHSASSIVNGQSVIMAQGSNVATTALAAAAPVSTSSGKARYKTMYACEDRQLTMDCDFGSKINLIRANYGRFSITQCNEQGQLDLSTDCMSPITFRIMRERCQDKQKCSVNATSAIFGDKCPKTRKYLEVHFQCQLDPRAAAAAVAATADQHLFQQQQQQPDRVDLRNSSQLSTSLPSSTMLGLYPVSAPGTGVSSILPPNNPSTSTHLAPIYRPSSSQSSSSPQPPPSSPMLDDAFGFQRQQQQHLQPAPQPPRPQPITVMNSEIISHNVIADLRPIYNNSLDSASRPNELFVVSLRHTHTENMSNPRCVLWDQLANKWTEVGSQIIESNLTHTTCAFDQATSYMLVMDYLAPYPTISQIHPISFGNQQQPQTQQQQALLPGGPAIIATQAPVPQIGSPVPGILELQPVVLDSQPQSAAGREQLSVPSSIVKFFSLFGYLLAFVFVTAALMTVAFVASTMRSSAGAKLKSLGNFTAFGGPKFKGRRADGSLHNKDLLVINNQNGHQFLYAPASTTKINSSSSTHILSTSVAGQHQGTLHQIQQQQMYSGNATLSNLSAAGGQSNNYYYGLMGLTNLYQQQQQSHHLSQHHLNQIGGQQQTQSQQQQQAMTPATYHHQANKSTVSTESANSSPSSSGVESGSTSMQQQQQQQQQQQASSCLVMSNDYSLMSHGQLGNYGQHQSNLLQQPTLTLNAHYSSGVPMNLQAANQQRLHELNSSMREHIYECVDDDKPYNARPLLPTNLANLSDQFNPNNMSFNGQPQNINSSRALTLSSRLLQNAIQQQQQFQSQTSKRPIFSHPAIIRDNQAAKTNIICSKMAQVTPQRATEVNKFHHDVMAIYNGCTDTTTTTTTANSSSSGNSTGCYSRSESNGFGANSKLSTDC